MHTEREPAAPACGAVTETSASQPSQALPLVVVVESDPLARTALQRIAQGEGFAVDMASTIEDARRHLVPGRPQLVVVDVDVPDGSGLELVRRLLDATSVDVVVTTGHASTEAAVDALRLGVLDYVTWPVDATHMRRVFANVRRHVWLRADVSLLRAELRHLLRRRPVDHDRERTPRARR